MREIVFDTETTGLDPRQGHRIVEMGCVELFNHIPTGRTYQAYLNPERSMPSDAARVHGLTDDFLKDKPTFSEVVDDFLSFIADDPLVIHNAAFDMNFTNFELERLGLPPVAGTRAIDTVIMARRMFPGAPASLDALCKRFGVDAAGRTLHGALLDAQLLAEVYLELRGGRQTGLGMDAQPKIAESADVQRIARIQRVYEPTPDELMAHENFLKQIKNPKWVSN